MQIKKCHNTLADIYLNGTFFMKINLMPASDCITTWSEYIKIQDRYHYQSDSISNTLYDIITTYNSNIFPNSYIIRIDNIITPNYDFSSSWLDLWNQHSSSHIAINVKNSIINEAYQTDTDHNTNPDQDEEIEFDVEGEEDDRMIKKNNYSNNYDSD
jgi:hypothetical protein